MDQIQYNVIQWIHQNDPSRSTRQPKQHSIPTTLTTSMYSIRSGCKALLLVSFAPFSLTQDLVPVASPQAGWKYAGCYSDNVQTRALTLGFDSDSMTNTQCVQFCAGKGDFYAGTEYAKECYCGKSLQHGGALAQDGCDMACAGNATEPCGGPNRLTLYNTTVLWSPMVNPGVNGYRYFGCYT
ncbi:WSC-domain-containing protein [Massarina eburnea CBS 473.64]|uniref:WSC-domain-containing protein n=1 Tax=Massarina eburnea CBS 473.64 TaxID=1395130 RepID=A0A6A6S6Z6_9PLEO|nr:WSC-domain-containing protein [Massarina eburnea CBS 473.64]